MVNSRIEHIDIAKGIAIISVIIGHLGISSVNRFVFTYDLPVFLVVSGYFMNQKHSIKEYTFRKIKALMVPYAVTCLLIIGLGTIKGIILGDGVQAGSRWLIASIYGSGNTYDVPFYIPQIGAIWYLPASCISMILLRCILQVREFVRPFFVLAFFIVGYLTSEFLFWFPMSVQAGLCSTFFMYTGWLYKNNENIFTNCSKENKSFIILISLVMWIMFVIQFQGFYLVRNHFGRGIIDIVSSLAASYLIIKASQVINNKLSALRKILLFAGRYSMLILCIHIVELDLFPWESINRLFLNIPDLAYKWILFAIKPIVILLATYVIAKIRIVRKLFGYSSC